MNPSRYRRALRYVHSWVTTRTDGIEEEVPVDRGDAVVPATLVHPRDVKGPLPGWIVLHGITRPGRDHAQLRRFMHATASTGAVVVVPEVPEWTELSLAPGLTVDTVRGAAEALRKNPHAGPGPYGVVGFSFGAPHAIAVLGHPDVSESLSGAVGFGGYCDLERTFRFLMTGRHEHGGEGHHLRPDPYGRWIVGANYLHHAEGFGDAEDVADALRRIAMLAGDTGAVAWDPRYDPAKAKERAKIATSRTDLFDLFAPPSDQEPEEAAGREIAETLLRTVRRIEPELEPGPRLARVHKPTHILHGRRDHLIPFTEALRLRDSVADDAPVRTTVTRLFGHSAQDPFPSPLQAVREVPLFVRAVAAMFGVA